MPDFKSWSESRLSRLRRDLDRLFEDLRCDLGLSRGSTSGIVISEDDGTLLVTIPMAGTEPDHVGLTVEEHSLTVELVMELSLTGGIRRETTTRTVALPCAVCPDKATAVLERDVLTVRLPKRHAPCPLRLRIDT